MVGEEKTTVYLRKRNGNTPHLFYCSHCARPIFKYSGSVVMIMPGDTSELMKAPFELKCPGKMRTAEGDQQGIKCPVKYIIEGFVEVL